MAEPTTRIMLLTAPTSYRAEAFLKAAAKLGLDVVRVIDLPAELADDHQQYLSLDFRKVEESAAWIADFHAKQPLAAIVSVDDSATELAAVANEMIGLPANDPKAAHAARDKFVMRSMMRQGDVRVPDFQLIDLDTEFASIGRQLDYPVVVKPRALSGSRGVIRADDPESFISAARRAASIIEGSGSNEDETGSLLVEQYLPGVEVAVEGLLTDGELTILAIFDKPDPLIGPFFEETIYVTPSRLSPAVQRAIADETQTAARTLGLRHGPIHAELRIADERSWLLEVAGRSIGGL